MKFPIIDPNIIGPPPERYASRIVAEMTAWLITERTRLWNDAISTIYRSRSYYGNPISQRRLVKRLRDSGGKAIIDIRLKPGKRGRYTLYIIDWQAYNYRTNELIEPDDEVIPERPWLMCLVTKVPVGIKDEDTSCNRLFAMTHHAMQRLAERADARTPFDLLDVIRSVYNVLKDRLVIAIENKEKTTAIDPLIPIDNGVAVIRYDKAHRSFIMKTVLPNEIEPESPSIQDARANRNGKDNPESVSD